MKQESKTAAFNQNTDVGPVKDQPDPLGVYRIMQQPSTNLSLPESATALSTGRSPQTYAPLTRNWIIYDFEHAKWTLASKLCCIKNSFIEFKQ